MCFVCLSGWDFLDYEARWNLEGINIFEKPLITKGCTKLVSQGLDLHCLQAWVIDFQSIFVIKNLLKIKKLQNIKFIQVQIESISYTSLNPQLNQQMKNLGWKAHVLILILFC
jgi:hypothetical protein